MHFGVGRSKMGHGASEVVRSYSTVNLEKLLIREKGEGTRDKKSCGTELHVAEIFVR
jgi:hypothetical protein